MDAREIIGPGGRFARICEGYEYREEQMEMAAAVSQSLSRRSHLLVEAGTGVGKTVAYLVPAILHALGGKRVAVSTHTINLQAQLVGKDIPLLRQAMEDMPFTAVLMKGRGNFVCLRELDHAAQSVLTADDPLFKRLSGWASESETGDVTELDFIYPEWHEVASNPDTCRRQECPYFSDRCFYYAMRRRAESANIVIVNHSLFFSDLAVRMTDPRNAILPRYEAVVFDEAHHLEDVAGNTFGIEFSNYRIPSLLNRLRKRRDIAITQGEYKLIEDMNQALFETLASPARQEFFFEEIFEREDPDKVNRQVMELLTALESLNTQLLEQDTEGNDELKERLDGYRNILGRIRAELRDLFFTEQPNYFRWGERVSGRLVNLALHLSPVSVAEILRDTLWACVPSVICTSATLSNSGTFSYLRSRLGTPECSELILGSPFDYSSQALLYVPDDLEQPSDKPEYADALAARIGELLNASGGRAFVLFTSYRMMNAVFDRLAGRLPFRLLKQGEMSNERLIQEFREDDGTCLMGVHSFWEGVDVKGERLSCVIIDKLPFGVPDSPTNKARCDQIERSGGDWFRDYAVPQAQIRLKQGFGRLIRTRTDRGVVAILDSRIHSRYYGREFVRYLPECKRTRSLDAAKAFLRAGGHIDLDRLAVAEE